MCVYHTISIFYSTCSTPWFKVALTVRQTVHTLLPILLSIEHLSLTMTMFHINTPCTLILWILYEYTIQCDSNSETYAEYMYFRAKALIPTFCEEVLGFRTIGRILIAPDNFHCLDNETFCYHITR